MERLFLFKSTRQFGYHPIHIISRKDQPLLASMLQKGLDAITDQEKGAIYNRWIGNFPSRKKEPLRLSQKEQAWLKEHPIISLGNDLNWPPYEMIDSKGQQQGLTADILELIGQRLGVKFKLIQQKNWSQTLAKLTQQPPAKAGGFVLRTESPDTGQRPV